MRLSPLIAFVALSLAWHQGLASFYTMVGVVGIYGCLAKFHTRAWFLRAVGADNRGPLDLSPEEVPLAFFALLWKDRWFVLAGLGLGGLAFSILQMRSSYFFSQDDNTSFFLPIWLVSMRSLFSGEFPVWNPYPGGGEPILECPTPVLYPLTILAYGISRFLIRNEFTLVEVFAFLHIVLGFLGGYWGARQWGLARPMALALALCFMLSGFILTTGRNWIDLVSISSWIPFAFGGLLAPRQLHTIGFRWVVTFAVIFGLSFHSGFSQIWVFVYLFYGVTFLLMLMLRVAPIRAVAWHIPAALLGLALIFPLLYVQMDFAKDSERVFTGGTAIAGIPHAAIPAIVVPPPLIKIGHPIYSTRPKIFGQYYYSNTLYIAALLVLLAALVGLQPSRSLLGNNVLCLSAVVAFLLVLGSGSPVPLVQALASMPWLNKFREPFRYFPIFQILAMFSGALVIDRLLTGLRRAAVWRWLVSGAIVALVFYGVWQPKPTFSQPQAHPYPSLPASLDHVVKGSSSSTEFPQRVANPNGNRNGAGWNFKAADSYTMLWANVPAVWGLLSFNRYNQITHFHTFSSPYFEKYLERPIEADRAYGIKWLVLHVASPFSDRKFLEGLGAPRTLGNLKVWEVENVAPMAFAVRQPLKPYPVKFSTRGVIVDFGPERFQFDNPFVINVLAWPRFRVYADGKPLNYRPDEWGRIVADVPAGTHQLEAVYSPPLGEGLIGSLVLALAAGILWMGFARWESRRATK